MPSRLPQLEQMVPSVLSQVDRLNVYLNNWDEVPEILQHPKIVVARSQEHGDRKGAAKWFWTDTVQGYHLMCDDDIIYPPDYVEKMVEAVDRHGRQAIIGVLGKRFREPLTSYYKSVAHYGVRMTLPCDVRCHLIGTGTIAYHSPTVQLRSDISPIPNMEDLWLARFAKENNIRVHAVARQANWLVPLPVETWSVYGNYLSTGDDSVQTKVMQEGAPWPDLGALPRAAHKAVQRFFQNELARRSRLDALAEK